MSVSFPDGFVWGVATASYQIEGAATEDGRVASIWDRFSHTPGKVTKGDTGDVACDHYHRYADDIALMKSLGVSAYRFSIAWPRILVDGKRQVNELGLAFYDRLVDAILEAGITPYATLYHWDLPQALEDEGGWLNRATADHFATYTDVISRTLGDRVKQWMTFNEPLCICWLGHGLGVHAPGQVDPSFVKPATATHSVYLAHGKAARILRTNVKDAQVGIVLNMTPVYPNTDTDADRAAANRQDVLLNRWYADPVLKGSYPTEALEFLGANAPRIEAGDMETIHVPLDFLGINYYFRSVVEADPDPAQWYAKEVYVPNADRTEMDWEIYADGLRVLLERVAKDYQPKAIYITENGCAMPDVVDADGLVRDPRRVQYLRDHFTAARQALNAGAPLNGYFVWSFMDNFEWAYGYDKRFGITHVDYATQRRTPKDSFRYYQQVIKDNAV
jgi:beta-glucosidase